MENQISVGDVQGAGSVEFLARQLVEGFITGLHKSPFHGFAVEFAEHRLYNTGESTRHIDWKVFGKTEKLFVKRYEEETNLRCQLVIDTSSSMYYPDIRFNKIRFSATAGACLTYLLQRQKDAIGLTTFAEAVEVQTPIKSTPSQVHKLLAQFNELLAKPAPNRKTSVADVVHELAERLHKRSLVVLFSDMVDNSDHSDELFSSLRHLRHNLHEVLLFHVTDKKTETDFDFDERPTEFIDLETGEKVKLQPGQAREEYRRRKQEQSQELKLRCGQYRINFIEVDIAQGFEPIMTAFLIKRAKML
jgi:uncharacterized protein (DUF58 family)